MFVGGWISPFLFQHLCTRVMPHPTSFPHPSLSFGSFFRKERFEAALVGYTENEALPKENSSERGRSQLPEGE